MRSVATSLLYYSALAVSWCTAGLFLKACPWRKHCSSGWQTIIKNTVAHPATSTLILHIHACILQPPVRIIDSTVRYSYSASISQRFWLPCLQRNFWDSKWNIVYSVLHILITHAHLPWCPWVAWWLHFGFKCEWLIQRRRLWLGHSAWTKK